MTEGRHPLGPLVDLAVYAPVGMAVMARDRLPELIATGRDRLETRIRVARMVGEFAVQIGRRELKQRWAELVASRPDRTVEGDTPPNLPEDSPSVEDDVAVAAARAPAGGEAAQLAIPGYDSLAASQVVDRLAGLTRDELVAVRAYEAAGRHRRTILHRVDQLLH